MAESAINISLESSRVPKKTSIELPLSKSESNRIIILLNQLGESIPGIQFSDSTDTKTLLKALETSDSEINLGEGGTTYRFLTAYFAAIGQPITLNCTERMMERPIGPLVDALRNLGADIKYLRNEGFPPLEIRNSNGLRNPGPIQINQSVSSQFASALCLISPLIEEGFDLEITGKAVSNPYLDMTLGLLREFGMEGQQGWK